MLSGSSGNGKVLMVLAVLAVAMLAAKKAPVATATASK
jgi:hypothetical protein